MPLVSSYKLLVFQHLSQDTKVKRKKKKKTQAVGGICYSTVYVALCDDDEIGGWVKKKKIENSWRSRCAVCCACVRACEGVRERDLRTEKMRCVIWDNRMIFKMQPRSYKLKENIKRNVFWSLMDMLAKHTNMPKLYFILLRSPKGHKWRRANPLYTNSV